MILYRPILLLISSPGGCLILIKKLSPRALAAWGLLPKPYHICNMMLHCNPNIIEVTIKSQSYLNFIPNYNIRR